MQLEIGQVVYIQSYKFDGSLHRTWSKATVLDIDEQSIVVMTYKTWVIEADGRRWFTKEPAVCFFYFNHWFNIIAMIRKTGIYYYCNIASPVIYDGEAIKNVDLDLDVKVFPDGNYIILDEDEFELHQSVMKYPQDVIDISKEALHHIISMVENQSAPFDEKKIYEYLDNYTNAHNISTI